MCSVSVACVARMHTMCNLACTTQFVTPDLQTETKRAAVEEVPSTPSFGFMASAARAISGKPLRTPTSHRSEVRVPANCVRGPH